MFSHRNTRPFVSQLAVGIFVVASCVATPVLADTPQAVTIVTHITFYPDGAAGTFEATGPLCSTGTLTTVDEHFAERPAGLNVNVRQRFVCDDNSGSFVIRLLPKMNADGFTFDGSWAVSGNSGTGAYSTLAGHGLIHVVGDWSTEPSTGVETYVGFVTLK